MEQGLLRLRVGRYVVRLVLRGMRYGLDGCLTHEKDDPLVEFYLAGVEPNSAKWCGFDGWFASRYYASTLMARLNSPHPPCGLALDGSSPDLVVEMPDLYRVIGWLQAHHAWYDEYRPGESLLLAYEWRSAETIRRTQKEKPAQT